jgi:hypothetical protein
LGCHFYAVPQTQFVVLKSGPRPGKNSVVKRLRDAPVKTGCARLSKQMEKILPAATGATARTALLSKKVGSAKSQTWAL